VKISVDDVEPLDVVAPSPVERLPVPEAVDGVFVAEEQAVAAET